MKETSNISELHELKMPKMGESITEGTIINWLFAEGESFEEGEILLEVATDKVDNEVPAPFTGTLVKTKFGSNDVVPVGEIIAMLKVSDSSKQLSPTNKSNTSHYPNPSDSEITGDIRPKKNASGNAKFPDESHDPGEAFRVSNQSQFFSPLIIKIAKEQHISFEELARIPSSGERGRLRKSDVFSYVKQGRPYKTAQPYQKKEESTFFLPNLKFDKGEGKVVKMDRMRQMIADHMVYSKHTSPHVTSYVEADLTDLVKWRIDNKNEFQDKYGQKLTFTPLFIEAVAMAIQDFPNINASVDGKNIIVKRNINIGMATALPNGNLIVPVVRDADKKDLIVLASEVNNMVDKARKNKLGGDDIKGGTFTISNVGTFGSLMGTPIINQPEVAILALGIIKKRPEVVETENGDEIMIRSMMYLSLSFDHRVVDGFLGGSFLKRVADNLEKFNKERTI